VETTSIAIIFLQQLDYFKYMSEIKLAIGFLQENMEGGYFGSTQATILALKAIAENMLLVNSNKRNETQFNVTVNGQQKVMNVVKDKEEESKTTFKVRASSEDNINVEVDSLDDLQNGEKHVFNVTYKYRSTELENVPDSPLDLKVVKKRKKNVDRYSFNIKNTLEEEQGMVILILHKPSYSKLNLDDLEMLRTTGTVDFYELKNNNSEIIFYWKGIAANDSIRFNFSLLDEFRMKNADPVAVQAYLYYDKEGSVVYESLN
jgi:hypothetical protein